MPQCAIAQPGSCSIARSKQRTASSWLNAYDQVRPWSNHFCASADVVVTGRPWLPRSKYSGNGTSDALEVADPLPVGDAFVLERLEFLPAEVDQVLVHGRTKLLAGQRGSLEQVEPVAQRGR